MDILILTGSPRRGCNTERMGQAFAEGAQAGGNTVTTIRLSEMRVAPCLACEYCFSHGGVCVQTDGMAEIFAAMDRAEMVVFASPIYYNGLSAQLAAVVDRLYARDDKGNYRPSRSALLLNSGSPGVYDGAIAQYKGFSNYLGWESAGIIAISGMSEKDSMSASPDLEKVKALGKSIS